MNAKATYNNAKKAHEAYKRLYKQKIDDIYAEGREVEFKFKLEEMKRAYQSITQEEYPDPKIKFIRDNILQL